MGIEDVTARESGPFVRLDGAARAWSFNFFRPLTPQTLGIPALRDCSESSPVVLLVNDRTGEVFTSRCKSPNLCGRCREISAKITRLMLMEDASEDPPLAYMVLTTAEFVTRGQLRRDFDQLMRALRPVSDRVEYFCALEWQARGAIHVNLLWKGEAASDARGLLRDVLVVWQARHRAVEAAQHCSQVASVRDVSRYCTKLARYVSKGTQGAPAGWRGHVTSQSRGYFSSGARPVREAAARELRVLAEAVRLHAAGMSRVEAAWLSAQRWIDGVFDEWRVWVVAGAHLPAVGRCDGGHLMTGGARDHSERRPPSAVERDVHYERLNGRLFEPEHYRLRSRGPHTEMS